MQVSTVESDTSLQRMSEDLLSTLSLHNIMLSELGFSKVLQQCVVLEHLEIMTDCQAIPVDAAVPSLKSLKSGSRYMSDAVLVAIGRRCAKLETLEIS
jgi:hypothetical protein